MRSLLVDRRFPTLCDTRKIILDKVSQPQPDLPIVDQPRNLSFR